MEASKIFAEKAQTSAEHMEEMTRNMEKLTEKTTKETVSMKIITLVTMFFLPGTFISVRFSSSFLQWVLTRGADAHEHRYRNIPKWCKRCYYIFG